MQLLFSIWKWIHLYIQKGVSLLCKGHSQKSFQGLSPLTPIILSSFISDVTSTLTMIGNPRSLPLVALYDTPLIHWPHPFVPPSKLQPWLIRWVKLEMPKVKGSVKTVSPLAGTVMYFLGAWGRDAPTVLKLQESWSKIWQESYWKRVGRSFLPDGQMAK